MNWLLSENEIWMFLCLLCLSMDDPSDPAPGILSWTVMHVVHKFAFIMHSTLEKQRGVIHKGMVNGCVRAYTKTKTAKFSSKANNYSILYLLKFPAIWCLFRSLQKLNSCNSVSFLSNWRLNYLRNNQTLKRRSHFWRVWGRILATLRVYSMCCRTSRTSGRWRVSSTGGGGDGHTSVK